MSRKLDIYFSFFILLLFLWQFKNIGKTFDDLRRSTTHTVVTLAQGKGSEFVRPHSGEEVIDVPAIGAITLLRENRIEKYCTSRAVEKMYWYHRIVEGSWPIRIVDSTKAKIFLTTEVLPKNCEKLGERHGMVLASCS